MGEENGCIKLLLFSTRLKIIASILLTLGDNNDQETSPRTHQHPAWDRVHPSRPTAFPLLEVLPSVPGKSPRFENPMCKTTENIGRSKYRRENGRTGKKAIGSRWRNSLEISRNPLRLFFNLYSKLRFRCVSF